MGVAEGRQIAFGEIQRLSSLTLEEAVARNDEVSRRTAIGPSGRRYRVKTSFYDEPDISDGIAGMYIEVKVTRPDLPISFKECIYLSRYGTDQLGPGERPRTRSEEVKERVGTGGCLILLIPILILLSPLLLLLALFGGEEDEDA